MNTLATLVLEKCGAESSEQTRKEYSKFITQHITYTREKYRLKWIVPNSLRNGRSNIEIMLDHGFPPAGYGLPFNEVKYEDYSTFSCSNSSD